MNPSVLGGLLVDFGDKSSGLSPDILHRSQLMFQSTCRLAPRSTDSTLLFPVSDPIQSQAGFAELMTRRRCLRVQPNCCLLKRLSSGTLKTTYARDAALFDFSYRPVWLALSVHSNIACNPVDIGIDGDQAVLEHTCLNIHTPPPKRHLSRS